MANPLHDTNDSDAGERSGDRPESRWSEAITIRVGEEKAPFLAHRYVLDQIPFFEACLRAPMRESTDGTIELPEDDPEHFDQILQWAYKQTCAGPVKSCKRIENSSVCLVVDTIKLIELYLSAEKFGLDSLCSAILYSIRIATEDQQLDFLVVNFAVEHLPEGDDLLKSLLKKVSDDIKKIGWGAWKQRNLKDFNSFMTDPKNGSMLIAALVST